MLRKIFILLFLVLTTIYLGIAVTALNAKPENQTCAGMELIINDSIDYGFVSKKEVLRVLNSKKLSPIGKKMSEINTRQLEEELRKHPLIGNAECYRTSNGRIGIEITQKLPILRVMANNGKSYYIDDKARTMPVLGSAAHVAIVTGDVDTTFNKVLHELGMFLQRHPLWKAQIQQINVTPTKELELVPRVGDHILFFGKPGDYENKFERLKTFYKKGLNEIGWNKYSRISLEFNKKIICTKKEK